MIDRVLDRFPEALYRAAALIVTLLSLGMAVAALILGGQSMRGYLPMAYVAADAQRPIVVAALTVYALLGGVLTYRMPRLTYGWLWAWLGFSLLFIEFSRWYTAFDIFVARRALPLLDSIAWQSMVAWITSLALFSYMLLLFPAGRLPSPRWRWVGWSIALVALVAWLAGAFIPGPMNIVPVYNPFDWLQYPWIAPAAQLRDGAINLLVGLIILSGVSIFARMRNAAGAERQQLKWFALAALPAAVFFALTPVLTRLPLRQYVYDVAGAVVLMLLALAMSVAILRFHLYEIDLIIRRTLVYTIVTLALALLYLGTVILLQSFLVRLTGQTSQAAIALSTLAIAMLFNPLRLRVQEWIDRRFSRRKYDAEIVLETFTSVARDETDLDHLSAELAAVVQETMQPTAVQVWLRAPNS